jgi:Ca2+-binding RTX toxin-like protein
MPTTLHGTSGDDSLVGTDGSDTFILSEGGDDTAQGGLGNDVFVMGATLTADDRLDGGRGADTVTLDGDYGAGLVLQAGMLTSISAMSLARGHSYTISGVFGDLAEIDGSDLGAGDTLALDASLASGAIRAVGGQGDDTITGGSAGDEIYGWGGDDIVRGGAGGDRIELGEGDNTAFGGDGGDSFRFGSGANVLKGGQGHDRFFFGDFNPADLVVGGEGRDTLDFSKAGSAQELFLTGATVQGIEVISIRDFSVSSLTLDDSVVTGGRILTVTAADALVFDGSAETQGRFVLAGSLDDDNLTGGAGNDSLDGRSGHDTLRGGDGDDSVDAGAGHDLVFGGDGDDLIRGDPADGGRGDDTLRGGRGDDTVIGGNGDDVIQGGRGGDLLTPTSGELDLLLFNVVGDSTVRRPDLVVGWSGSTITDLHEIDADTGQGGDQAFHLAAAFTGQAGEAVWSYDSGLDRTTLLLDDDGDAHADMAIVFDGDARPYDNFVF